MKRKSWIIIMFLLSTTILSRNFNILFGIKNDTTPMKSYDISDYEVIEIHYDHNDKKGDIKTHFDANDASLLSDSTLIVDDPRLCATYNNYGGGYIKLEINTNKIVISGRDNFDEYNRFGLYDGKEAFCNFKGYYKQVESKDGALTVDAMKVFSEKLMSEENRVITDDSILYEYATILSGKEAEMVNINNTERVDDFTIKRMEFIDQDETRLVKIDFFEALPRGDSYYDYDGSMYYKIVLKKDNSEFEKEYDEIYDEVKDVPYIDK